jgi:hypothetical protein
MLILVVSTTVGVIITAVMLGLIGFDSQGILVVILFSFPLWLFSVLYGFYKGLVKYYDFKGSEKLFLGGKF